MTMNTELIEVRKDEKLNEENLKVFFSNLLKSKIKKFNLKQFSGGHANLTYLISVNDEEYVLRRPPLGPIAPSSHDMKREHKVQRSLHSIFPLVPNSIYFSNDISIIGNQFHIIERKKGFVIRKEFPDFLPLNLKFIYQMSKQMIKILSDLHKINPINVGLENLGKPEGFVKRQLFGWEKRWKVATENTPLHFIFDHLLEKLKINIPRSKTVSIIHNDFKLDNIMWNNSNFLSPEAIFDWDMCTLGDPLMDLGHMLNYWIDKKDDEDAKLITSMPTTRNKILFPLKSEIINLYSKYTGFDVTNINWYYAFGAFKLAVILQQIYVRFLKGQTKDKRFANFNKRIDALIKRANGINLNQFGEK